MKRVIFKHTFENMPGESELYLDVLIDGSNIIEREKMLDPMKPTIDRKRYKTVERHIDPSVAGYDLVDRLSKIFEGRLEGVFIPSRIAIDEQRGEQLEIYEGLMSVFTDHPRHHWSPALSSKIAELAGRVNWNTPAQEAA